MWKLTDSEWKVLEALWAGGPQHLGHRVYDGSAGQLVAAFVKDGSLSPQEREELRRLLDEMEV